MSDVTPVSALIGGGLIGAAAAAMWLVSGRVAGVSGVLGAALTRHDGRAWRLCFLAGLVLGGLAMAVAAPTRLQPSPRGLALLAAAGFLVGVGTALANGCTSGHGVCGIGRLSPRSLIATITFMLTGGLAVVAVRALGLG